MHASEESPVRYLGWLAAAAAVPLIGAALLNLAMDPYSSSLGRWYRLRAPVHDEVADRAPDQGTAARANAVARSRAPVLLLGTSRTQEGFAGDPAHSFNAGQAAATLEDVLRVAESAAHRPSPPALYVIEAPSRLKLPASRARTGAAGWPGPAESLIARESSHVSLHLLGHSVGAGGIEGMREDFFLPRPAPAKAPRVARLPDAAIGAPFEPARADPLPLLSAAFARLRRLCVLTRTRIVVVEPPLHPDLLHDARVARVAAARLAALRAAAAAPGAGTCRIEVADFSGIAPSRRLPAALEYGNWLDRLHFSPEVGAALLESLEAAAPGRKLQRSQPRGLPSPGPRAPRR